MENRIIRALGCAALLALLVALSAGVGLAETDGMLRVKLTRLGSPAAVTLTADCALEPSAEGLAAIPAGTQVEVAARDGVLTLSAGGQTVDAGGELLLARVGEGGIRFVTPALSNRFCGDLRLTAAGSAVSAVLNIYVEDYLRGVVGYEMAPSAQTGALEAQAVAARSYALYQKNAAAGDYDLTDTAGGFTYKGACEGDEYANALQAVDATRGIVLWAGTGVACGYCTESNGGQMESAEHAFGGALPYTRVQDDAYDYESSGVKKSALLRRDAQELPQPLLECLTAAAGQSLAQLTGEAAREVRIAAITSVTPGAARFDEPSRLYTALNVVVQAEGRNAKGNATTAQVTVSVPTYGGLEEWCGLGINEEDNETIWIEEQDEGFEITFRRSGHGVGMSQRGAQLMANQYGMDRETILEYYYPGTRLETLSLEASATPAPTAAASNLAPIALARLLDRAELLSRPEAGASVSAALAAGAAVEIYAVQQPWAAVGSSGKLGYVDLTLLSGVSLTGADVIRPDAPEDARLADAQLLRVLPTDASPVLRQLAAGEKLTLSAHNGQWAEVTTDAGEAGFVPFAALGESVVVLPEGMTEVEEERYAQLTEAGSLYDDINGAASSGILERRSYVRLLALSDQWAYVQTPAGTRGFVQRSVLKEVRGKPASSRNGDSDEGGKFTRLKKKQRRYVYVTADSIALYKNYSESSQVLATLNYGQKVLVGAYNRKWAYVHTGSQAGFALRSALGVNAPPARAAAPEEEEDIFAGLDDFLARAQTPAAEVTQAPTPAATQAPAQAQGPSGGSVTKVKGKKYTTVKQRMTVLYKSWSVDSDALAWLEKGDKVQVLAYNQDWAYVYNGKLRGYVQMSALLNDDSAVGGQECDAVTLIDLKLYADDTMTGTALTTVPKGAQVHVYSYDSQSAYVEFNSLNGYLPVGYITRVN